MLKKIGMFSLLSCMSAMSFANVDSLKSNLNKQYPNIQVSNIQPTEMTGLYSASLDNQII
ncbi:MAG: DsbC family protein, partial [Acinetobacter sp.]|nr:DsbC family protein [Acinetobacter sp.]